MNLRVWDADAVWKHVQPKALKMKLVDPPEALLGWNVVDGKAIDPKVIHQKEEEEEPDIAFY